MFYRSIAVKKEDSVVESHIIIESDDSSDVGDKLDKVKD